MDNTERIHLMSVKDNQEIEVRCTYKLDASPHLGVTIVQVLDLKKVELVYNSSFFKAIETGGNVSKALVNN